MTSSIIPSGVLESIRRALEEDIGPGDITTSLLIPDEDISRAQFIAKDTFILAGIPFAREVFRILSPAVEWMSFFDDGDKIRKGDVIAEISGTTSVILTGERVSLNILQRLSGIATLTNRYVERIQGLKARIADTRKTVPGMRFMEKYAVRKGGGYNHRFGLFDGILIKNNHLAAVGSISEAVKRAKQAHHLARIEVEVENLHDLIQAVESGADIVMLDNMSVSDMSKAVQIAQGKVLLEASGGINLDNVREIASTGVDIISVGALTHSASAVDISMQLVK
ncbi:MAG: nicotinate-nucleotide pyrophosphorylase [Nitrospira bacterium SM23_35]|jgi:nicotinate-nucleotide pyrophosphorylase (carboxylating)|nr:MAG: nicotinate-nucleotide pyrophosphorylase [Nitrospira bacterium SM23_35]